MPATRTSELDALNEHDYKGKKSKETFLFLLLLFQLNPLALLSCFLPFFAFSSRVWIHRSPQATLDIRLVLFDVCELRHRLVPKEDRIVQQKVHKAREHLHITRRSKISKKTSFFVSFIAFAAYFDSLLNDSRICGMLQRNLKQSAIL